MMDQFFGLSKDLVTQDRGRDLFTQFLGEPARASDQLESRPVKNTVVLFPEHPYPFVITEIGDFTHRHQTRECLKLA
jgi:hypothetical protein